MLDLSATSRKREGRSFFPRNGSWITKVRTISWGTWQNKKLSHHHRGDHDFFIAPCTPIPYTAVLRPIAVSRVMRFGQVTQPNHVPHRCPDRGFVFGGANFERLHPQHTCCRAGVPQGHRHFVKERPCRKEGES
jgi:hypothetical protein